MKPVLDFGFIHIPTFYLVISMSVTFILLLINAELNQNPKLDRKTTFDLTLIMMIAGFIGGRLTHVIYEEPSFYAEFPLEIFKFWKGGFVFYGGFILALIAVAAYLKSKKQSFYIWADFFTPYIGLSYALGRMGCFFEGCCFGSHCELPWAITGRHPTQLYMALAEVLLLASLMYWRKKKNQLLLPGLLFLTWLCGHAINRFIIEYFREDDRGSLIASLSISQWLSVVLFVGAMSLIVRLFNISRN
ncbi:prolipoprotein diacylglyceryl transferase [Pseudobdellovibrio sp. HCB154]|uniref:prolipoprotein diacylglyceryl transferase n=1 Tax=Pseudobdellovibrio sp. HCB154 TaxID=3386277 RepID=UPI003916EC04